MTYVRALKGRKNLLKGNHDHERDFWYEDIGFKIAPKRVWFTHKGRQVLFTHAPEVEIGGWAINIHGHIHNNGYEAGTDRTKDYRNVSVEVMNYTPVRLREILEGGKYESIQKTKYNEWSPRVEKDHLRSADRS